MNEEDYKSGFAMFGGCVSVAAVVALHEWNGEPWWEFVEGLAAFSLGVYVLYVIGMALGATARSVTKNKWLRFVVWLIWMAGMVLVYAAIGKKLW